MPRSCVAESPNTSAETRTPSGCRRDGVAQERGHRLVHRLRVLAGVADDREVAVAREADVVELDLVEARLRRGDRDVDVVVPGAREYGFSQPSPPLVFQSEPSLRWIASSGCATT